MTQTGYLQWTSAVQISRAISLCTSKCKPVACAHSHEELYRLLPSNRALLSSPKPHVSSAHGVTALRVGEITGNAQSLAPIASLTNVPNHLMLTRAVPS